MSPMAMSHGSILGAMLFNLYMNDLISATKECEIESYVDDTNKDITTGITPTNGPGQWNFASGC